MQESEVITCDCGEKMKQKVAKNCLRVINELMVLWAMKE
jgi:hypothetical protein